MNPRPIRVLMIEDSLGDAQYTKKCLRESGDETFDADHASRMSDGLQLLADHDYDVLLLDLGLPDSQGMSTFTTAFQAAPRIPIILMTSIDDLSLARSALRKGAQDYLQKKDIDTELLIRSIRYSIERKRAQELLRESQERYALAVQGANDGIWDWDLRSNRLYLSPRCKTLFDYNDETATESPDDWLGRVHPDYLGRVLAEIEAHKAGNSTHFECEYLVSRNDGGSRWILTRGVAVKGPDDSVHRMAGSHTDITPRKETEIRLRHEALHDSLTNLPNRSLLWDHLTLAIAQARRRKDYKYAVLFIDLDRFKIVNDSLGHTVGDQFLIQVGRRLEGLLRDVDTLARLGGDEYVMLLADIGELRDATRVAERVLHELHTPFLLDSHEVTTSASIGIAMSSSGYDTPEHVLRDADTAMYRAKSRGRGCYEVFDPEMHHEVSSLMRLETDLRHAVAREEFVIYYQPIVALETGRLTGFEALVRWEHPDRGLVNPNEFISVAEETGLILPLGKWVLEEACRQLKEWKSAWPAIKDVYVAVNLSSRQLTQPDFTAHVRRILHESGLASESLKLEITESMLMESEDVVVETLSELRALGVRLLIDDFGTGYSSLNYLHRFPVDHLKIDRSFISRMSGPDSNPEIVRTIIHLAENLQLKVIAEGVETFEQMDLLRGIHVEEAQGFYFSRPLDSKAAGSMFVGMPTA